MTPSMITSANKRGGLASAARVVGAIVAGGVMVVGAALTMVFAATLAVIAVIGAALFGVYALALRARRPNQRDGAVILEARKVGHSWVAYGWDRRSR